MSQTQLTSFFNSRKRSATDEILSSKSKIPHIDRKLDNDIVLERETISHISHNDVKNTNDNANRQTELANSEKNCSEEKPINVNAFGKKVNASNVAKGLKTSKSEAVSSARKDLSLGDIKKILASSSRLAVLKASAEHISKGIQQLQQNGDKRNLKAFKSIDVEVPISPRKKSLIESETYPAEHNNNDVQQKRPIISPRKVFVSPVKSPSKVPAYLKYASLATSSILPLPHQYRFLAELFWGIETVVSLLYNRNEIITFSKLRPSVQEMLKRNFTEKHLTQIKHLVPDFYNFEIQQIKKINSLSHKESYELVITPNIPCDIKILNPSVLLERRRYFYDVLLKLVKKHHSQYLQSLEPPMEIPDDKLVRWHPNFELENLPEVECAKLPEAPNKALSSAQDVLAKARQLFKFNNKMERPMQKPVEAKSRGLTEEGKAVSGLTDNKIVNTDTQTRQPSTSTMPIVNPALRNLPTSLLEKVKAKQAAKALEAMTCSSENYLKYLIYSRLPDLARTLRNIYVTERKNVLALNIILSKLDSSFKSNVSATDLLGDIKVLSEEVPHWIKLHDVRNTTYLKLDKNTDLKTINAKLEALAEQHKPL